jgi:Flp pilus assembly protein TadD
VAGRIPDAFEGDVGGIGGRLDEWRVAATVVAANPLTGVGPEGYRIAFGTHVDDAYEMAHGRQPLPDRAHSALLDVASTLGLPGLAAYLALLAVVGRHVLRALWRGPPPLVGMAVGLLGYVVQSAFLFPLAELDPLAWMLAGLVVAATMTSAEQVTLRPARLMPGLVALAALVALVAGGLDVAADRRAKQSLLAVAGDRPAVTAPASELRPDAVRYHLVDARVHESLGTSSGLDAALEDLDQALHLSPLDPLVRSQRTRLLLERARRHDDPAGIGVARQALEDLAVDDPRNAEVLLRLGLIRSLAGDGPGAEAAWLEAERLAPDSAAASTNLAVAYARMGRAADAVAAAERALARDPTSRLARQVVDDFGT